MLLLRLGDPLNVHDLDIFYIIVIGLEEMLRFVLFWHGGKRPIFRLLGTLSTLETVFITTLTFLPRLANDRASKI